ncbi:MAG: hypothetical protein NVSMB3_07250 [Acidobacteriaceae bacterium]
MAVTLAIVSAMAHADFTYQETTEITGGSIVGMMKMAGAFSKQAREAGGPMVATVMVKGNRMTRVSKQHTEIIDLDRGTVTDIYPEKKKYVVMTFEQMRKQMEAAISKAKAEQQKAPQRQTSADAQNVDMKFNVHVRSTGAAKDIAGVNAKESIMTMTMDATDKKSGETGALAFTNDMWMAAEVPGYEEVRDFYLRYAEKMGTVMNGAISPQILGMMQQPGAGEGMADMVKEMAKLKGLPVLQVMRMGTTANGVPLPAASEAALPASNSSAMPSAGDVAQDAVTSAIASKLGSFGMGGFGRKKKAVEAAPAADANAAGSAAAAAVLVESNTTMAAFSRAAVDDSVFAVPAGYRQEEPGGVD